MLKKKPKNRITEQNLIWFYTISEASAGFWKSTSTLCWSSLFNSYLEEKWGKKMHCFFFMWNAIFAVRGWLIRSLPTEQTATKSSYVSGNNTVITKKCIYYSQSSFAEINFTVANKHLMFNALLCRKHFCWAAAQRQAGVRSSHDARSFPWLLPDFPSILELCQEKQLFLKKF